MEAGMKYLITGGTGSFGQKYVEWLTDKTAEDIIVFSRDEYKQWEMKKRYPDVKYIIGDIRNNESVNKAIAGVDYVIHAAALKHVATGENFPGETIETNITGTQNVVDASNKTGAKMILISTDKAVQPVNLYGATKMIAEKITINGGQYVVRYGNVFGSKGSILHIFKEQAAFGDRFTITDRRMTRFIITYDEAIKTVNRALAYKNQITIPDKLRAIKITDLALAFDDKAVFDEIGIQPGEKYHEVISLQPYVSSEDCPKMSIQEIQELINANL
jgi:UDP-N-acetylglucosamine 4,6-dehydratase